MAEFRRGNQIAICARTADKTARQIYSKAHGNPNTMNQSQDTSTPNDWSRALRYVAGRKAAEETLGYLAHVTHLLSTASESDTIQQIFQAVAEASVPMLGTASWIVMSAPAHQPGLPVQCPAAAPLLTSQNVNLFLGNAATPFAAGNADVPEHMLGLSRGSSELLASTGFPAVAAAPMLFQRSHHGFVIAGRGPDHPRPTIQARDVALVGQLAQLLALYTSYSSAATGHRD
ncbi:MAG: hypothetical protein ACRDN0_33475 [Trebonia sp.]